MPFAPARCVCCIAFFIARRKLTRFTNCAAMFSATNTASSSTFRTSMMFANTSEVVSACSSARRVSSPEERLPNTKPGLAA
jgi:hypothetical protein